jgi:glucose/arabinose dehydrogenase
MIAATLILSLAAQGAGPADSPYLVEYYTPPAGEVVEVGGIAFVNETDVLVSTRRGRVWWVANALAEDPADAEWTMFVEGLYEGLGLNVVDGRIYVLQRGELSELIDHDGDRVCDEVRTVTQDWGMTGNYHEFAFGLPVDAEGNFYMSLNLGFWSPEWWHGMSKAPNRGWILKVSPEGEVTPIACGARSPCGLGMNSAGDLFYTDNQGDWMPSSPIFHVQEGAFFGHPNSLRWTEEYRASGELPSSTAPPARERTDAAVWLPYSWSRTRGPPSAPSAARCSSPS